MLYWNIAIAAPAGQEPLAKEIRERLARTWNSRPEAKFTMVRIDELTPQYIEDLDAAVLIVDGCSEDTHILTPLTLLEELHISVLALVNRSPEPGSVFEHTSVMIDDRAAPGSILSARIHGMLHRQAEVNRLRREVALTRRSQEGLEDEVSRIHSDLQLAAQAQRGILPPSLPSPHGIHVASLWRPAQYVSGDIYDVIQLDDDRIGLFLADAVGHGVAAALMTMVICQSLTTRVRKRTGWKILDPCVVMKQLNEQMCRRQSEPARFATAVYAVLDGRKRHLTLAGAGHPAPILFQRDGGTRELETSGALLGVFKDEAYDQIEVQLEAGDRMLLYSDGFSQAFPREDEEGIAGHLPSQRYRDEFRKLQELDGPQDMVEAIAHRIDAQAGSLHQADDLTLLCVEVGRVACEEVVPDSGTIAA